MKALRSKTAGRQKSRRRLPSRSGNPAVSSSWQLRLYVAGQTPKSIAAIENLRKLCDETLNKQYRIEIIDLIEQPQRASEDQIVALPTLVRKLPQPIRKIIGDLSNTEKVLVGLDLRE